MQNQLFTLALGLTPPWAVESIDFDAAQGRIDLTLNFPKGSRFTCPECGTAELPTHDTNERTWRHLDFFQHQAYLHARVPRVRCDACGVKQVAVPWSRPGSGFTLLFEALALELAQHMAVSPAAKLLRIQADSLWRILGHYVESAREDQVLTGVRAIGIDETSRQKGHQYVTTFCDLDTSRLLFVAPGKASDTIGRFCADFEARGGDLQRVQEVATDMSAAFIAGVREMLPDAQLTFDRYHVMAVVNAAVDAVRRQEVREEPVLKRSRYLFLKNQESLSPKESRRFESIRTLDLKTVQAYHLKTTFQRFFGLTDEQEADTFLSDWLGWAKDSRLGPMVEAAYTIERHAQGILAYIRSRVTNGVTEGLNSKIKAAARRAYGFKTFEYYRTVIYLVAGKLRMPTLRPTLSC